MNRRELTYAVFPNYKNQRIMDLAHEIAQLNPEADNSQILDKLFQDNLEISHQALQIAKEILAGNTPL